jgi:hypothetical protein
MPRQRYMAAGTLTAIALRQSLSSGKPQNGPPLRTGARLRAIGPERDFHQRAKNAANNSNPTMEIA